VREVATLWEIDLVFIPPGCTDLLQPLDRRVFGVMKSFARQNWRRQYHRTGGAQVTRPMIAQSLIDAWDRITPDVIESAWEIFEPDWNDAEDSQQGSDHDGEYQRQYTEEDFLDFA
jgi:hypothetical protein